CQGPWHGRETVPQRLRSAAAPGRSLASPDSTTPCPKSSENFQIFCRKGCQPGDSGTRGSGQPLRADGGGAGLPAAGGEPRTSVRGVGTALGQPGAFLCCGRGQEPGPCAAHPSSAGRPALCGSLLGSRLRPCSRSSRNGQ